VLARAVGLRPEHTYRYQTGAAMGSTIADHGP
jgi:hypothetical protein